MGVPMGVHIRVQMGGPGFVLAQKLAANQEN